jgi:hypothetical protein
MTPKQKMKKSTKFSNGVLINFANTEENERKLKWVFDN